MYSITYLHQDGSTLCPEGITQSSLQVMEGMLGHVGHAQVPGKDARRQAKGARFPEQALSIYHYNHPEVGRIWGGL